MNKELRIRNKGTLRIKREFTLLGPSVTLSVVLILLVSIAALTVFAQVGGYPVSTVSTPEKNTSLSGFVFNATGGAVGDAGVDMVRIAIRNTDTLDWLQSDGTFSSTFAMRDATLDNPGATSTNWTFPTTLPNGNYGLSVRAVDGNGNVEVVETRPWVLFSMGAVLGPALRDTLAWPFANDSIWNMSIHYNAEFVSAGISTVTDPINGKKIRGLRVDQDIIILTPDAPLREMRRGDGLWGSDINSAEDRCVKVRVPTDVLFTAPIPDGFRTDLRDAQGVQIHREGLRPNHASAVLMPDGETLYQVQPIERCSFDGYAVSGGGIKDNNIVNIFGDGRRGTHGGSGLSSIGGTIRLGELLPSSVIHHALKINLNPRNLCSNGTVGIGNQFVWPAVRSDGNSADDGADGRPYDPNHYQGTNPNLCMGSLLALEQDFDVSQLNYEPARIIADALKNYGAYVVDSSGTETYQLAMEFGVDSNGTMDTVRNEFERTWGFPIDDSSDGNNNPWQAEMRLIFNNLGVVTNNAQDFIGGGPNADFGNRRAQQAPAFDLGNNAPSISSVTDTIDPVLEGSTVQIDVSWSDPDGDHVAAIICQSNAISAEATCPGGAYEVSPLSGISPINLFHATTNGEIGINNYYAFVCDDAGLCSSGVAGTFTVNAIPPLPPRGSDPTPLPLPSPQPDNPPPKYTNGDLVRVVGKETIYVVQSGRLVAIPDIGTFNARRYNWDAIKLITTAEFDAIPEGSLCYSDGALIRAIGDFDVWIVKYMGSKQFRRLVLSPHILNSYGHLRWEDIIDVDPKALNAFTISNLVRAEGDDRVFFLNPSGDTGSRHWVRTANAFIKRNYDWEAIYTINTVDREAYLGAEDYN